MPLRRQEFREICTHPDCDEWSTAPCLRCGRPFCDQHKCAADRRCDDCEQTFERLAAQVPDRKNTLILIVLLAVGGWVLASATGFLVSGVALLVGFLVVPITAGVLLERYSSARRRRAELQELRRDFLAERKRAELPPADSD